MKNSRRSIPSRRIHAGPPHRRSHEPGASSTASTVGGRRGGRRTVAGRCGRVGGDSLKTCSLRVRSLRTSRSRCPSCYVRSFLFPVVMPGATSSDGLYLVASSYPPGRNRRNPLVFAESLTKIIEHESRWKRFGRFLLTFSLGRMGKDL